MLWGKLFPEAEAFLKNRDYLINACESKTWVKLAFAQDKIQIQMDSEARVVKGLLIILAAVVQEKTVSEIAQFDFAIWFAKLGIEGQLSPSRTNGLYALVKHIQQTAKQYLNFQHV